MRTTRVSSSLVSCAHGLAEEKGKMDWRMQEVSYADVGNSNKQYTTTFLHPDSSSHPSRDPRSTLVKVTLRFHYTDMSKKKLHVR